MLETIFIGHASLPLPTRVSCFFFIFGNQLVDICRKLREKVSALLFSSFTVLLEFRDFTRA